MRYRATHINSGCSDLSRTTQVASINSPQNCRATATTAVSASTTMCLVVPISLYTPHQNQQETDLQRQTRKHSYVKNRDVAPTNDDLFRMRYVEQYIESHLLKPAEIKDDEDDVKQHIKDTFSNAAIWRRRRRTKRNRWRGSCRVEICYHSACTFAANGVALFN